MTDWRELIEKCWDIDFLKRPEFYICQSLEEIASKCNRMDKSHFLIYKDNTFGNYERAMLNKKSIIIDSFELYIL